jgi:hypothetical protein
MQPAQAKAETTAVTEETDTLPNLFDLIERTGIRSDYQGPCVGDGGPGQDDS